jgi:cell division protein FtsI/penicillin-binding protein 2
MTRRGKLAAEPGEPARLVRRRVTTLFVIWIVAFSLLLGRLADVQVFHAHALQRMAMRQQLESLKLPARRGLIVDRNGRPLAINVEVQSVYAVPHAINDAGAFARAVGPPLHLTPADVEARLRRAGPYFAWLARRQPAETVAALRRLELGDSIGALEETRREYPAGQLAAAVIGFAGAENAGLAGLELSYERVLRGEPGIGVADRDAIGRELVQTQRILSPPRDGGTLVLTLDEVVQHIAERELLRTVQSSHAQGGTVVVMDPNTGGIMAMAALPSFDPNRYQSAPAQRWKSRAVADVYEPGSTFKLILAAAALSRHAVRPDETFTDPGKILINGAVIHDAEPPEHTRLTLADVVKYSSNVGAAQVATRVGKDRFYRYIRRLGFGERTRIDLPGEASGIIRPVNRWYGPSLQNIGFGQGISVTPIQLLVAVAAFGTHGRAVRPHLVQAIRDPSGHAVDMTGNLRPYQMIEPSVADQILAMMRQVVEGGTGVKARLAGYEVAGKTGTAQRPASWGGYEAGAYVSSFVGVVPVPSPRLAILVIVDRPHGVYFGGEVAAPAFREIAQQILWYLRVPPAGAPE